MSSPTPPAPAVPNDARQKEIKIVSHSNLFYWWPVWAVGFILFVMTLVHRQRMAIVPPETRAYHNAQVQVQEGDKDVRETRDVLVLPEGKHLQPEQGAPEDPHLRISNQKTYGVLFAIVLLLVIVITNVPLRGLWSVVVIVLIIALSIIFALAEYNGRTWWDYILEALFRLHIYINAAG
ncbi:MAG TPA: hypothetical protein VKI17_12725, partial [Gemmataceae bacterium]|nr:hypothetical protein [Gemmataceae bacterium]